MILFSQDPRLNIYRTNLGVWLDPSIRTSYPGTGTAWSDLSGAGRTATLVNGPTFQTAKGGEFNLDGTNDYATGTSVNTWTAQTICIWLKVVTPMASYVRLIEKGQNNEWCININYDNSLYRLHLQELGTYNGFLTAPISLNDDLWHQCVVTISSTNFCRIYIDGALSNSAQCPRGPAVRNGALQIGRFSGGGSYFWKGGIGHVAIYNQELSASEVGHIYNTTKTRFI